MAFTDKQIDTLVHILCDMSDALYDSVWADSVRCTIMGNVSAFYNFCNELQRTYTEEDGYINEDETINVLIAHDSPVVDDVPYWNARVLTEVMEQVLQYTVTVKYKQTGTVLLTSSQVSAILDERFAQVATQTVSFTLNEKTHTATYFVEGCITLPSLEKSVKECIDSSIKPFTCLDTALTFTSTVHDGWYEEDNTLYDLEQHLLKERAEISEKMQKQLEEAEMDAYDRQCDNNTSIWNMFDKMWKDMETAK